MINLKQLEVWFVAGSQHLYGAEALQRVDEDSQKIVQALNYNGYFPVPIVLKPVLKTPDEIHQLCQTATTDPHCIGLITWMHTFSPAKMWIGGLNILRKPLVHLHTQLNRDIPWATIDMDYMNLHQSAHGGREFGFIGTRMRLERKVVVGHWQNEAVLRQLDTWLRAACAWHDARILKIARFGDNMRQVAVTEGDKVAAQIRFGYSVNGYGLGDLVPYVKGTAEADVAQLVEEYEETYQVTAPLREKGRSRESLVDAAQIELGLRAFLDNGGFKAFTTTFENLHGLKQLPGISVQRLMADGYGFGAEGDWKTAALLRNLIVMANGL